MPPVAVQLGVREFVPHHSEAVRIVRRHDEPWNEVPRWTVMPSIRRGKPSCMDASVAVLCLLPKELLPCFGAAQKFG